MRKALFTLLLVLGPCAGNAAVVVDGNEWRDLTETTSLSFAMMVSRCNFGTGACQGSLLTPTRTISLDGWTWASATEVAQLFDAIIKPQSSQYSQFFGTYLELNSPDIQAYVGGSGFAPTFTDPSANEVSGGTRSLNSGYQVLAYLGDRLSPSGIDSASVAGSIPQGAQSPYYGQWMYRIAPVPLPAAAWLLLSGVGGIAAFARRRRAQ